jgi:hypothetical protein
MNTKYSTKFYAAFHHIDTAKTKQSVWSVYLYINELKKTWVGMQMQGLPATNRLEGGSIVVKSQLERVVNRWQLCQRQERSKLFQG